MPLYDMHICIYAYIWGEVKQGFGGLRGGRWDCGRGWVGRVLELKKNGVERAGRTGRTARGKAVLIIGGLGVWYNCAL
jgi:hypothetical protein